MKKRKKVGITGGIGSGKSTACMCFRALGIPVYDADTRAKALMTEDKMLITAIQEAFGKEAYLPDSQLNRSWLAERVFHDPEAVKQLNALVHPRVHADFAAWEAAQPDTVPYVLDEAALLIESGGYKRMDALILVSAPEDERVRRVPARDPQRDEAQVRAIIARQLPEAEKRPLADFILENDGQRLLSAQVWEVHRALCAG